MKKWALPGPAVLLLAVFLLWSAWAIGPVGTPADPITDAELVLLATRGTRTLPIFLSIRRDASGRLATMGTRTGATIEHAATAVVRGAAFGDHELLVTAQQADRGDLSFASDLWRVSLTRAARELDEVALASRPLVVGRRAYIQRGQAGVSEPSRVRDDDVFITELDLDRDTTRTVAAVHGQLAYPVGVDDDLGLVTYLIGGHDSLGDGGRLVAFSLETGAPRDLATIGTARDFSLVPLAVVEGRALGPALVYEAIRPRARSVEVLPLGGSPFTWIRGATTPLSPSVLPGGQLITTQRAADGSLDVVRGWSRTLHALLIARYAPDRSSPHFVVRATDGAAELVLDDIAPTGARLEPVGFVDAP